MPHPLRCPPVILLDDSLSGRGLLYSNPRQSVCAESVRDVPAALAALDAAGAAGYHAAGFLAYEAAAAIEPRLADRPLPDEPLLWFLITEAPQHLDAAALQALLEEADGGTARGFGLAPQPAPSLKLWYDQAFQRLQDWIAAGDIYQANLTFQQPVLLSGDGLAAYRALRRAQPVGFGAYADTGTWRLLSLSPELFFASDGERLTARPMKGTAARHPLAEEDDKAASRLAADPKQRAENLMIVDLLRNDLSRVAVPGSVAVPTLFALERYPSVHQMTSTISADRLPDLPPSQLIQALFPCGSVTGAPKLRAMQCLAAVEPGPRGVYTGAIGYFAPDGRCSFNVAIRTLVLAPNGHGRIGLGSGIVADSEAETEWRECALKARFLKAEQPDFALIETMVWQPDHGVPRLRAHLERLTRSAAWFGRPCDADAVRAAITDVCQDLPQQHGDWMVRLHLAGDGSVSAQARPVPARPEPVTLALSPTPVHSENVFLYHKTSHRSFYENPRALLHDRLGVDDVLFVNERGELTEAARGSLFVQRGDRLVTPPLSAGLLPGLLRAELLASGHATEATLRPADLRGATALFWGNSVTGLKRAQLIDA